MAKVLSALARRTGYNSGEMRIHVTLDRPARFAYRAKEVGDGTAYLAIDGDVANFLFHAPKNQDGFGGATFTLKMEDGSVREVKGPWSGSPSGMNRIFDLDDPLVDCTEGHMVCYVRKSALEALGVDIVYRNYGGGDDQTQYGYWEASRV